MFTERQCGTFLGNDTVIGKITAEKLRHDPERFIGCHNGCSGVNLFEIFNICRVIRLHMLNHKVIRLTAIKSTLYIIQPFVRKAGIDCVHNGDFIVKNDI